MICDECDECDDAYVIISPDSHNLHPHKADEKTDQPELPPPPEPEEVPKVEEIEQPSQQSPQEPDMPQVPLLGVWDDNRELFASLTQDLGLDIPLSRQELLKTASVESLASPSASAVPLSSQAISSNAVTQQSPTLDQPVPMSFSVSPFVISPSADLKYDHEPDVLPLPPHELESTLGPKSFPASASSVSLSTDLTSSVSASSLAALSPSASDTSFLSESSAPEGRAVEVVSRVSGAKRIVKPPPAAPSSFAQRQSMSSKSPVSNPVASPTPAPIMSAPSPVSSSPSDLMREEFPELPPPPG